MNTLETAGLDFPLLVRPIGSHGGDGVMLADTAQALSSFSIDANHECYLTRFHDFRSADGFYRKYRIIFVGRRGYPYHLAISSHWLVHHVTANMEGDPARISEELRFLEDPETAIGARAMAAAQAIGRLLDLDYAGIDFSVLPDGRLLVFEANATMLVHPEAETGPFAHKNPFVQKILEVFQNMIERNGNG